jgi:hypothetical protein
MKIKPKDCQQFKNDLAEIKTVKSSFDENFDLFCQKENADMSIIDKARHLFGYRISDVLALARYGVLGIKMFGGVIEDNKWMIENFSYDYQKKTWVVDGDLDLGSSPDRSVVALPDNLLIPGHLKLNVGFEKLPEHLMVKRNLFKNRNKIKIPDTMVVKGEIMDDDPMDDPDFV